VEFSVIKLAYERKREEFLERLKELSDESVIYVADLVSCPQKRSLRLLYPELSFKFEPHAVLGDAAHAGLQQLLAQSGFEVEKEVEDVVEVSGRAYKVKGRVDAYSKERGLVVEIKTGRSGEGLPREHHLLQVKAYMAMLGARKGLLVYLTSEKLAEFEVELDEGFDLGGLVEEHVRKKAVPKWPWECKYCPYSRLCPYAK